MDWGLGAVTRLVTDLKEIQVRFAPFLIHVLVSNPPSILMNYTCKLFRKAAIQERTRLAGGLFLFVLVSLLIAVRRI